MSDKVKVHEIIDDNTRHKVQAIHNLHKENFKQLQRLKDQIADLDTIKKELELVDLETESLADQLRKLLNLANEPSEDIGEY